MSGAFAGRATASRAAAATLALGVLLAPGAVRAFSSGESGLSRSGCGGCHSAGATAPPGSMRIAGPMTLIAGSQARFTLSADGLAAGAGFDLAASAGSLAAVDVAVSHLQSGELTHTSAWPHGSSLALDFDFTAPTDPGRVTLAFTVLSVNGDGGTDGDAGASGTFDLDVQAPPDLAGADLLGIDFAVVDMAAPPPDLAGADFAMHSGKVYVDEKRAFGCALTAGRQRAAGEPAAALALLLWAAALVRRRPPATG